MTAPEFFTAITVLYKFPAYYGPSRLHSETFQIPSYDLTFETLPPVLAKLVLASFAVNMSAKNMPHTPSIIGLNSIDVIAIFIMDNPVSVLNEAEGPYKIWI